MQPPFDARIWRSPRPASTCDAAPALLTILLTSMKQVGSGRLDLLESSARSCIHVRCPYVVVANDPVCALPRNRPRRNPR